MVVNWRQSHCEQLSSSWRCQLRECLQAAQAVPSDATLGRLGRGFCETELTVHSCFFTVLGVDRAA